MPLKKYPIGLSYATQPTNPTSVFNFQTSKIRATTLEGSPWFVVEDVFQVVILDLTKGMTNHFLKIGGA